MSRIEIRKAARSDAALAWELRKQATQAQCLQAYPQALIAAWTMGEQGEDWADSVERDFYLAVDGDAVLATGMLNRESARIEAVFVHPEHMRQGIGRQMMAFLETQARASGLHQITLEATLNAVPFYRSCGFAGECAAICQSARIMPMDCMIMSKCLDDTPASGGRCAEKPIHHA
jgi:GNAT superfamily N-acetyltransferase